MVEEFTSIAEVHDKIEFVVSLKSKMKIHYERILDFLKNFSLSYYKDQKCYIIITFSFESEISLCNLHFL
jgi:hypothetical protein